MSDLAWLIFFAHTAPKISNLLVFLGFIMLLVTLLVFSRCCYLYFVEDPDNPVKLNITQWLSSCLIPFFTIVIFITACLIPSERTIYLMAGANVATDAAQTEEFTKVRRIINDRLDSYLEDMEPNEE